MADVVLASLHSSFPTCNTQRLLLFSNKKGLPVVNPASSRGAARFGLAPGGRSPSLKVEATIAETSVPKWWEKNAAPNMVDIHSEEEFLNALSQSGDRLVIVEFYGTWCASCRALFPKLCKTAKEHPEILFLKVNFDENKAMCKRLNVRVLPYFHFYSGSHGLLDSFSCSLSKFQKIRDVIETHGTASFGNGSYDGLGKISLESITAALMGKQEQAGSN